MHLGAIVLLAVFTIWAVVWATDKSGASIPWIGRFNDSDSKRSRYYLTGMLFYWPTMLAAQLFFWERYYRRGYRFLHLVSLLMFFTGWVFAELYGLRATVLAVIGWGIFGQIVMVCRYESIRVTAQAGCAGLALAFLLISHPWWSVLALGICAVLWFFRRNPLLSRRVPLEDRPRATI